MKSRDFLPFCPKKLISLWDMVLVLEKEALYALKCFQHVVDYLFELKEKDAAQLASLEIRQFIAGGIMAAQNMSEALGLADSKRELPRLSQKLGYSRRNVSELYSDVKEVQHRFLTELEGTKFVFIPESKITYFDNEKLLGEAIYDAFPEARAEIKEVGNAIACELNTAAVFHLMRIAEMGLRKLAKKLKVTVGLQIEFATWGQVIQAIEGKLKDLKATQKSKKREEKLHHYSEILLDIRAFNYLWRDPVMHVRSRYDEHQAQSAFNHVSNFLERLSKSA